MYDSEVEIVPLRDVIAKPLSDRDSFVLVVDDDELCAELSARTLLKAGYVVMMAYDAESALQLAKLAPPILLVADIGLGPAKNGVELAIRLRSLIPDCKVLFFSGHADALGLVRQAQARGFDFPLLQKPASMTDLLDEVCKVLSPKCLDAVGKG